MDKSEIYGRLGSAYLATNSVESQQSALGLFMTTGIAYQYKNGQLTKTEAQEQIKTITESGQVPDPIALKAINDAFTGAKSLQQVQLDGFLDESFKAFGIMAAPMFATPTGAVAVSVISSYGAPFIKYLNDPNNIFTGQFAPPQLDPILHTGAVALEQLERTIGQKKKLKQIYKNSGAEVFSLLHLDKHDPALALAAAVTGELAEPLQRLLEARDGQMQIALGNLEQGIYRRMSHLETTTNDILKLLKEEKEIRERQKKIEEIQKKEKLIQQEINGAISLVDAFAKYVIGDANTARKVTGCLKAASTAHQLFSGFVGGSLGPLGLAGGLVNVIQNVFGLFGDGAPDPTLQRLNEIDRKLERMTQILLEGFQHLDRRLTDVLNLSHTILQEVILNGQVIQARLRTLDEKINYLLDVIVSNARNDIEVPIIQLAGRVNSKILNNESLEAIFYDSLSDLVQHAKKFSRFIEMNGQLRSPSPQSLSDLLDNRLDIRTVVGNLQYVVTLSEQSIDLADQNPPDIKHWSRVVQGLLEMLLLNPDENKPVIKEYLSDLWEEGNALKSSILTATNSDLMLCLLDQYEATTLRERSNASINSTLDELVANLLAEPISQNGDLKQHIENKILLFSAQPFLKIGVVFRYLLSILVWRISNVGDNLSINPKATDLVCDKKTLTTYLIELLAKEATTEGNSLTENREGHYFIRSEVRDKLVKSLKQKVEVDIIRLRGNLGSIAHSRRVRDVDEALLGISAIAKSRKIDLKEINAPFLRLPYRVQPRSIYEVSDKDLINEVRNLCEAAGNEFIGMQGEVIDTNTGVRKFTIATLGLSGLFLQTGTAENVDGRRSHARIFFPEPFNREQGREQLSRYENYLFETFPGISRYDGPLLPPYVRETDAAQTLSQESRYYSRALQSPTDPPSELALILREIKVSPDVADKGHFRYVMELWVFTRKSGAILRTG